MLLRKSKSIAHGTALGLWLSVSASATWALDVDSSRRVEEEKRQAVDVAAPSLVRQTDELFFISGAWANSRLSLYRNSDHDKSTEDALSRAFWGDLRVWGRAAYRTAGMKAEGREHFLYLRVKDVYALYGGEAPGERFDNRGPQLDYGYAAIDIKPWKIEMGRRYFNIGRGFVYSGVHDGVQVNYQVPGWNVGAFLSCLPPHTANTDTSVPGYDKDSRRYFSGLGVGYGGIKNHQVYGYTVLERDRSREKPEDEFQDYGYQAEYVALGSKGQWAARWPYWVEVVRETGHSREDASDAKSNISAWALAVEQKYQTGMRSKVVWSAQYVFGSGDPDRESVTNTVYGNAAGRDQGFRSFGYLPTGIALSPVLSNLHMARVGAEGYPFYSVSAFRKLLLRADYYRYWKHRSSGGTYDIDTGEDSNDIGQEVDVQASWRVTPRVTCSAEWGYFMPGRAYWEETRTHEQVVSVSTSIVF